MFKACTDIVNQLAAELDAESASSSGEKKEEGESLLLLPLIQGILQNPKYHNLSARQLLSLNLSKTVSHPSALLSPSSSLRMNSEHTELNDNDRLGNDYLPIEDSGTESGEDLRLLAAGLQSNLANMDLGEATNELQSPKVKTDALGAGLLMEVTSALARLQNSLNQGEIDLDDSKKVALLSLVNRLQRGLISPEKINDTNLDTDSPVSVNGHSPFDTSPESAERRGSSGGINRFAKRRIRTNRHTVGVTREELADARRIIEELELIGMKGSTSSLVSKPKFAATMLNSKPSVYNAVLTRQFSEPVTLLRPSQFVPKEISQQIELPIKSKYKVLKQSISLDQPVSILKTPPKQEMSPKIEDKPTIFKKFSIQRNSSATNNKFVANNHKANDVEAPTDESSSSDDEDEMVNTKYYNNNTAAKFKAKENYLRNQQTVERSFNYSSGDETSCTPGPRQPKYTSKKMKMKRANTVDLPKSFSFVNTFDLSDRDGSDTETGKNTFQSHSGNAGLRTTITGGSSGNKLPPQFTPKTENDKKFLAFINKQNTSVTPSYVNPSGDRNATKTHNWTNKFGNLKNKFQGDEPQSQKPTQKAATNSAANFWKTIEKDKPVSMVSPLPPVVQPFVKNLPLVSEKFPWKSSLNDKISTADEPVVLRKKQMMETFVPKEKTVEAPPRIIHEPNKLPVSKPSSVNNFSHAPMSAFKPPISRKISNSFKPITSNEEVIKKPLPQVSNGIVKQLAETGYSVNNNPVPQLRKMINSPTRSIADSSFVKVSKPLPKAELAQPVPWAAKPKSERVLNLAASKFEQGAPTVHLDSRLQAQPEPVVKYRNNPLYNGTFEKRSSLPPNASYASFDANMYALNGSSQAQSITNINNATAAPKESTFVITDFTQPTSVSTYAFPAEKTARSAFSRQESLTNPDLEPLVLTCSRNTYSPKEKPKPMEIFEIPTPNSSQLSNDHSVASICDDLDHELEDLGGSVECNVAVSRVMVGPVAQTAYTSASELTNLNDQGKENTMMKSLQDSLKKLSQKSPTPETRFVDVKRLSQESSTSSLDMKVHSPFKIQSPSRLSQDSSNSSIDFKLPSLKIPIAAVPETAYSIKYASPKASPIASPPKIQVKSPSIGPPIQHVLYNNVAPTQNHGLQKARSSHMLAIPKPTDPAIPPQGMYGASQSMVAAKQKTMESYFGPKRAESLSVKPQPAASAYVRPVTFSMPSYQSSQSSAISKKISLYSKPVSKVTHQPVMNSLSRSRTMPSLANVELLDESNIDDAFEELLSSTNL